MVHLEHARTVTVHRLLLEQVWAHFDALKFATVISPEIGISVVYLAVMAAYRNGDVQVRQDGSTFR
jgi:hypothetical protein